MEALAALGLASNVAQFVDFASRLLSKTVEVAGSAQGTDAASRELEDIYTRLKVFSSGLVDTTQQPWQAGDADATETQDSEPVLEKVDLTRRSKVGSDIQALEDLARECGLLCDELLGLLQSFRAEGSPRGPFKSFLQAAKTVWGSRKIKELSDRLARYQGLIALHFLPVFR